MLACTHVANLTDGISLLRTQPIDLTLLDMTLPDSRGIASIETMKQTAINTPVIVLTNSHDESRLALHAIKLGVANYLMKDPLSCSSLTRSIHYAIERHRLLKETHASSLLDKLTGLYNTRGFLLLFQEQLKVAHRIGKPVILFYISLDNFSDIAAAQGSLEGDFALIELARLLVDFFRDSDIVSRVNEDEFAVSLTNAPEGTADMVITRLQNRIEEQNRFASTSPPLSISVGVAHYHPDTPRSVEELVREADLKMYKEKQIKKGELL